MRTVLLVLTAVLVVVFSWWVMIGGDVEQKLLQQPFFESVVEEVPVGQIAQQQIAGEITDQMPQEVPPLIVEALPEAFKAVFDEAWFESAVLSVTDDLLKTVKGEQDQLTAVIDIEEKKTEMFDTLLAGLNELSDEELRAAGVSRMELEFMAPMLRDEILGAIPNQFPVAELVSEAGVSVADIQQQYSSFRSWYIASLIVLIPVFIIVLILLAGKFGALRWAGWSLVVAGALYLLAVIITRGMASSMVAQAGLPPEIDPELLAPAVQMTFSKFIASPIIAAAIGIVLVALSIFLPKQLKKD